MRRSPAWAVAMLGPAACGGGGAGGGVPVVPIATGPFAAGPVTFLKGHFDPDAHVGPILLGFDDASSRAFLQVLLGTGHEDA